MSRSRHFSNRSALRCGRCEHNRLSFLFSFAHFRSFSTMAPSYRVPRYGGGNVSGILGLRFQLALLCGGEPTGSRRTTAPIDTAALGADELRTLVGEVRSALHAHRDGPCAALSCPPSSSHGAARRLPSFARIAATAGKGAKRAA